MVVDEIMTSKLITAGPSTSIHRVLDLLGDADVRHIPIVDQGELVGIVSDRDLRSFFDPPLAMLENPAVLRDRMSQPVSAIMSCNVVTVTTETELVEVIDLMLDQKVGAVPVVNDDSSELVGIVSYMDVLRAARAALAE